MADTYFGDFLTFFLKLKPTLPPLIRVKRIKKNFELYITNGQMSKNTRENGQRKKNQSRSVQQISFSSALCSFFFHFIFFLCWFFSYFFFFLLVFWGSTTLHANFGKWFLEFIFQHFALVSSMYMIITFRSQKTNFVSDIQLESLN